MLLRVPDTSRTDPALEWIKCLRDKRRLPKGFLRGEAEKLARRAKYNTGVKAGGGCSEQSGRQTVAPTIQNFEFLRDTLNIAKTKRSTAAGVSLNGGDRRLRSVTLSEACDVGLIPSANRDD